jgi:hypothetical protein
MNTSDDDLNDKKIVIKNMEPISTTSRENIPQKNEDNKAKAFMKNAYSKLVSNIKTLATGKGETKEPEKSGEVNVSSSQEEQADLAPKTCKDKVADALISKVEVPRNLTVFFSLLAIGSFLLCISILMIPLIITSPRKFSMTLAFGSIFLVISFLFYYGTKTFVLKLFDKKRFLLTILYLSSFILALFLMIINNYFLSLLSSIFQVFCLVLFGLTFIPGGKSGINYIKKKVSSPFVKIFMNMAKNELTNN